MGGESLPEMQELRDRLDRADDADDRDAELRDIADRMDALAEQYELAGPQGEHAADRFRLASRAARGERDQDNEQQNSQDEEQQNQNTPENEGEQDNDNEQQDQDNEEDNQRRRDSDLDGGAADPDGEPDGGGADAPGDGGDSGDNGDGPDNADGGEDGPDDGNDDQEEDEGKRRRRRRRRNRDGGNGGPNGGGPGGPGLPHMNMPESDTPSGEGDEGDGRTPARHRDVDSLRSAWKAGDGLTPAEDTPERRAHLAELADREGLALSPEGGLAMWPEQQDDGSTVWRFAQARNGTNLPGIALTSDNPEEASELTARFEDLTDRNGDLFDWNQPWGPAAVAAWRDGEGRNLPQALRAVQEDYERERASAFVLPEDLTTLDDAELEAAYLRGLGPKDELRVMAEMDRRDGYVDEKVRAAMGDTPPANAEEAEREGKAMDAALGFGDTDVTQPAPATPGNLRREFDALDEERFQAAMEATGGRFLSPEAEAAGVDPREVFSGRKYSNKRAKELASPELNLWLFGDETTAGNGRLTYSQYRQREADRALHLEFADWNEARHRAAIEFTNGYFYKQKYKYSADKPNETELFSGGSLSAGDRWREYASEELVEWYDLNGGRVTFNQWKQQRRENDRIARHQYEEEQRAGSAETDTPQPLTADDVAPARPFDPQRAENIDDAVLRYGSADRADAFADRAELRPDGDGGAQAVWLDGRRIGTVSIHSAAPGTDPVWDARPFFGLGNDRASRTRDRNLAVANLVVQAMQDGPADPANPGEDVWDSVMLRLAGTDRTLPELPESLRDIPEARARYDRLAAMVDAFRDGRSPSGDLRDDLVQARDDFAWLRTVLADSEEGGQPEALFDLDARAAWAGRLLDGFAPDSSRERPHTYDQPGSTDASSTTPATDGSTPSPADPADGSRKPEPEGEPAPVGGQPAHWARVEDLVPGDMVRMDGTTRKGKPLQRAGYVYKGPELVDVTRRGRTTQEWRTWVTENPDGTGAGGNVYTTLNATAARAEAPDDVTPGSPATGAQSAVQTGNMPERVPSDRNGRALFPGSAVTGVRGIRTQEGTVTGATDTTVSVRWDDDDTEDGISPTTLAVTDSARPDGWTSDGHQVRPGHVVTDTDGALLGPVDEVEGDKVTVSTAQGTTTRSAGDLRVTGEVSDTAPGTAPVTDIDHPAAADLKEGDVIILDRDGALATVAVTGTRRDGDRVTVEYADTTTGEVGEIDMDAAAILPRAKGENGNAPELGPDDAPDEPEDLTVHEPPRPVDPVTGTTIDPDLTEGDRGVIDDHASGPDDNPDAQQAAARIAADLPVTPEQAAALATQLRQSADPATPEGRAALRAADHLDQAAGRTPPAGFDRPRPSNVAQLGEGDLIAMPDERNGDRLGIFRVIDIEDAPGGVRSLLLEDENQVWRRRIVHGAMPVWQLPEAHPAPPEPPAQGDGQGEDSAPRMRVEARYLSIGEVVSVPVNGEQRRMLVAEAQRSEDRRTVQLRLVGHDGRFMSATVGSSEGFEVVETPAADGPGRALDQEGTMAVQASKLQPGQHLVVGNGHSDGGWYTRRIEAVDVSGRWVTVELVGIAGGPTATVRYELLGGLLAETVLVAGRPRRAVEWFVGNRDRLVVTPDMGDEPSASAAPSTPASAAPSTPAPGPAPAAGAPAPDADTTDGDDDTDPSGPDTGNAPAAAVPDEPSVPIAQVRPGNLRAGDVIDAPVSRAGYQFNGHRRLTIISAPHRNGWWMQLTGMDEDGNVHDFGLHAGRAVNVYDRNRPTPALPPVGELRDPNPTPQSSTDRIASDQARSLAARIIGEAVAGTEPPGDIHALREQIAQRLTPEALRNVRDETSRDGADALDAAGITGSDRDAAQQTLRDTREQAHTDTVRAALRTINDLEPLPGESNEDLAARARDLLRLIPGQVADARTATDPDADPDVARAVTGHVDDAMNALLQQLQAAGVDPGDAERIARIVTRQLDGSRQATARRIARRIAAASPEAARQPGLLARIVAFLIRLAKRLALLVKAGARKIAEKYRSARERLRRLRAFLGRLVRRVRQWPESRRLARLHRAVNLPDTDGGSLAGRISHWAGLMPEPGRFGQAQRRVTLWRPTTWGQLAAGRLPGMSDRIQWAPDRAADGGPGLAALRHMAALRAAGGDVDQDVTRRLAAVLGDDFGDDPHVTLQHADDYVATSERRLVNLQAARSSATIPDDPDLEIEIDAARMELSTARREYADLRARYAAAVPDAVAAALAEIRDVGPDGSAGIVFGPDSTPDAERAVRGVQRVLPRSWLATGAVRGVTAVDGDEGRYEPSGQRITVADLADEGLSTAGHGLAQHLARHIGDLDAAQRAFWFTRTHTGRPGARRMRSSALDRLLRRQQTQPDTGDSLARSVQAMFNGDWYQDDDLRAFLLGLMATR
ncbi:DNA 3'-5' helicase OS=Streptomyces griseomycini OX=66895 GN=FHS37_006622 PE=4 SV=1 [Streptomyces griseomycini]